jgi:hypothetical protein
MRQIFLASWISRRALSWQSSALQSKMRGQLYIITMKWNSIDKTSNKLSLRWKSVWMQCSQECATVMCFDELTNLCLTHEWQRDPPYARDTVFSLFFAFLNPCESMCLIYSVKVENIYRDQFYPAHSNNGGWQSLWAQKKYSLLVEAYDSRHIEHPSSFSKCTARHIYLLYFGSYFFRESQFGSRCFIDLSPIPR